MNLVIEKYIKYEMKKIEGKAQYVICDFKGNTLDDLEYVSTLLSEMYGAGILDRVDRPDYRGWHNDAIAFDREGDKIGITSILDIPEGDWHNEFHYTLDRASFEQVVGAFADSIRRHIPFIYLIKLSNGQVVLQENLKDNNITLPASFPKYIKLTFFDEETDYQASIITSQTFFLLYSFVMYFNLEEYLDDQFVDGKFQNAEDSLLEEGSNRIVRSGNTVTFSHEHDTDTLSIDLANFDEVLNGLADLQNKNAPDIYIIQEDDGKIVVRESL
jgi:hypothetical protein